VYPFPFLCDPCGPRPPHLRNWFSFKKKRVFALAHSRPSVPALRICGSGFYPLTCLPNSLIPEFPNSVTPPLSVTPLMKGQFQGFSIPYSPNLYGSFGFLRLDETLPRLVPLTASSFLTSKFPPPPTLKSGRTSVSNFFMSPHLHLPACFQLKTADHFFEVPLASFLLNGMLFLFWPIPPFFNRIIGEGFQPDFFAPFLGCNNTDSN